MLQRLPRFSRSFAKQEAALAKYYVIDNGIRNAVIPLQSDDDGMIALRSALSGDVFDITDATYLQRYIAQMPTPYPINETAQTILYS